MLKEGKPHREGAFEHPDTVLQIPIKVIPIRRVTSHPLFPINGTMKN